MIDFGSNSSLMLGAIFEFTTPGADNIREHSGFFVAINGLARPYYGDNSMTTYSLNYDNLHYGSNDQDFTLHNYTGVFINTGASDVDHDGLIISAHTSVAPDGSVLDLSDADYGSVFGVSGSLLSDVIYLTDTFDNSVEWSPGNDYIMGSEFGGIGDRFKGSNYKFEWGDPTDQVGVEGLTFEFNNGILTVDTDQGLTTAENISRVYGSRFDDVFIGDEHYQNFRSEGGSNTYTGGVGEDSFRLKARYDNGILRNNEARITDLESADKIGLESYGFSYDLEVVKEEFSVIRDMVNNKTYISIDTDTATIDNIYTIDGIFYLDSYSMTEKFEDVLSMDSNLLIIRMTENDPSTVTFTATVDKWQSDGMGAGMDGPSMKLHRKDITDEVGIDLIPKGNGEIGHNHKPDMDKGDYELRVEHTQETDGAIDIEDVMGVLSLARGRSTVSGKEHELAADWNGDGLIDIEDVMGVLSRARGRSKDDEWRFHEKTTDTSLWDNDSKTNKLDITLDGDGEIDLSTILRGDVNGSYDAAVHNRAAPASAPEPLYAPLPLSHEDELLVMQVDVI